MTDIVISHHEHLTVTAKCSKIPGTGQTPLFVHLAARDDIQFVKDTTAQHRSL